MENHTWSLKLREQQLPPFNVFWYDAARDWTHDLPIMRRTLYWLSQHTWSLKLRERAPKKRIYFQVSK